MLKFDFTPAPTVSTPGQWPARSLIKPDPWHPMLLMALHPRCACSVASVGELNQVLRRCPRLAVRILLYQSKQWQGNEPSDIANSLPQGVVFSDSDGAEAARFGLITSGETVLYSSSGRLLFKGGITSSRGHAGENIGRLAVIQLANGQSGIRNQTPTFGCSLLSFTKGLIKP